MMARSDYPLHIIHGYSLSRGDAEALSAYVVGREARGARPAARRPRHRVEEPTLAALVLARLLAAIQPERDLLLRAWLARGLPVRSRLLIDPAEHDALGAARGGGRASGLGREMVDLLMTWTAPLLAGGEIAPRLRRAACQLSNIGWHQHPEYRALQALDAILHAPDPAVAAHRARFSRADPVVSLRWPSRRPGGGRDRAAAAAGDGSRRPRAGPDAAGSPTGSRAARRACCARPRCSSSKARCSCARQLLLTGELVERDLAALLRAVEEPAR